MKLRLFIGSASEDLNVANAINQHLEPEFDCVVWDEPGVFKLSRTPLSSILEQINDFDVGILVFGAHDATTSRQTSFIAARDNVIFEHGLFGGRHGADHSVIVRDDAAELKWPSDLKGFTPVHYNSKAATTDEHKALKIPCDQIKIHLRQLVPKSAFYLAGKRSPINQDWWTYALYESAKKDPSSLSSSQISDEDSFEFATRADIGVRRPPTDTLDEQRRYCALRVKATQHTANRRFYVALAPSEKDVLLGYTGIYLALADSYSEGGWAATGNEFKAKLPYLTDGRWHKILIDFTRFYPFLGDHVTVKGFRLRPGLKVSHICTFDEKPEWLEDAEEVKPETAPFIQINHPKNGDPVSHLQEVEGQSTGVGTLQAIVFSGGWWHPQAQVDIRSSGFWSVQCQFGYPPEASGSSSFGTHKLAILTGENPIKERSLQLPAAVGRDCISVRRA